MDHPALNAILNEEDEEQAAVASTSQPEEQQQQLYGETLRVAGHQPAAATRCRQPPPACLPPPTLVPPPCLLCSACLQRSTPGVCAQRRTPRPMPAA